MPRPCNICISAEKARLAAELIAAGTTDQAIADRLGVSRMTVHRHRHAHVLAPARAIVEASGKARDAIEQRGQIMAAAEAGDPTAFIALANIVADLKAVHDRLERSAAAAETDGQRMAVAGLSAQQLRAAEVRAKMGNVGGYGARQAGGAEAGLFTVNIMFSNGDRSGMTVAVDTAGPVIDHQTDAG